MSKINWRVFIKNQHTKNDTTKINIRKMILQQIVELNMECEAIFGTSFAHPHIYTPHPHICPTPTHAPPLIRHLICYTLPVVGLSAPLSVDSSSVAKLCRNVHISIRQTICCVVPLLEPVLWSLMMNGCCSYCETIYLLNDLKMCFCNQWGTINWYIAVFLKSLIFFDHSLWWSFIFLH